MKVKIATDEEWRAKRYKFEREAKILVFEHRMNMVAMHKNKGLRVTYDAYQELLPAELRIKPPVIIIPSYMNFNDHLWRKESRDLYIAENAVKEMIKTDEKLKTAYEQYLVMARLTS